MRTLIEIVVAGVPFVAAGMVAAGTGMNPWVGLLVRLAGAVLSLALATLALRKSGSTWKALGLARPRIGSLVLWSAATLVVVALIGGIIRNTYLFLGVTEHVPAYPADLWQNPALLVVVLILVWAVSAIGEELLFRGFIMDRLRRRLPEGKESVQAAVLVCGVLYGLAYLPWGGPAAVTSCAIGMGYGALYFGSGRSLWPVLVAHGILATLAVLGHAGGG